MPNLACTAAPNCSRRYCRGEAANLIEAAIAYQTNTYRVLTTRARYATVIWVPEGDVLDNTRDPETFSSIPDLFPECDGTAPHSRQ